MPFGYVNNPNGRTVGSRNKRTTEIFERLEARGDLDPADYLSSLVTNQNESKELRAQAANFLLPYKYGKRGIIAVARFVPDLIEVPKFETIDQAEDYLNAIATRLGLSEIDSQSALEITSIVRSWIDSRRAAIELDLKIQAQGGATDTTIRIEGGLPSLPGTNINMAREPTLNGHTNGHVIDHEPTAAIESEATDSPTITKD